MTNPTVTCDELTIQNVEELMAFEEKTGKLDNVRACVMYQIQYVPGKNTHSSREKFVQFIQEIILFASPHPLICIKMHTFNHDVKHPQLVFVLIPHASD